MGKQGKPTPPPIQDFLVKTYQNAPGLTYQQLADRVAGRFGEAASVDRSTVPRILRKRGARPSGGPQASEVLSKESHSQSIVLGPHESDSHQEDLLEAVRLLWESGREDARSSLEPSDGIEAKLRQALGEHLPGFLDTRSAALRAYTKERDSVGEHLERDKKQVDSELPDQIVIGPWDRQITEVHEGRAWFAGLAWPADIRVYHKKPLLADPTRFIPVWGKFELTFTSVTEEEYLAVKRVHVKFQKSACKYFPRLRRRAERLREEHREFLDKLEELVAGRKVPGRCHFC